MNTAAADILRVLNGTRFHFTTEDELHQGVAQALTEASIRFYREWQLDAKSRIDFFFDGGLGLECKINGSVSAIARQVQRYALHPDITTLILLSRRANVGGIPNTLNGKPIHVVSLWSQSL